MKRIFQYLAIFSICASCNTQKSNEKKIETVSNIQPTPQKTTETIEQAVAKVPKKFVYVKIIYETNVDGLPKTFIKSSDITEVDWLDGNKMAKMEDEYISSLSFWKEVKILDRKCVMFNSYYEASENRFKTKDQF